MRTSHKLLLMLNNAGYISDVQSTNPIAYWPLNEGTGLVAYDRSGNGRNGLGVGLTWDGTRHPSGSFVPYLDKISDYIDIYTAGLGAALNFDEGSALVWADSDDWTELFTRRILYLKRDANNIITITHTASANGLYFQRSGGASSSAVSVTPSIPSGFVSLFMTWSLSANQFKAYLNNVQLGTTQTVTVGATGSGLSVNETLIGAISKAPTQPFGGYPGHGALWDYVLSDAQRTKVTT